VSVPDGSNLQQIAAAQRMALLSDNNRPTAIVYRTQKGWRYGIEGRASHGAGHKLCSRGFFDALSIPAGDVPCCEPNFSLCDDGTNAVMVERCYWQALSTIRNWMEGQPRMVRTLAALLGASKERLASAKRKPRQSAPCVSDVYALVGCGHVLPANAGIPPSELRLTPGHATTLRGHLGK